MKTLLLSSLLVTSLQVTANDVNSVNGIAIQLHEDNFYEDDGGVAKIAKPYCLSQGAQGSDLTFTTCDENSVDQKFSYDTKELRSNSGLCLTQLTQREEKIDYIDSTRKLFITSVAFNSCNGDSNQIWDLNFAQEKYQLQTTSDNCLSLSGGVTFQDNVINQRRVRQNQNYAAVNIKSCEDPQTSLDYGEIQLLIIEKKVIIPIIM